MRDVLKERDFGFVELIQGFRAFALFLARASKVKQGSNVGDQKGQKVEVLVVEHPEWVDSYNQNGGDPRFQHRRVLEDRE